MGSELGRPDTRFSGNHEKGPKITDQRNGAFISITAGFNHPSTLRVYCRARWNTVGSERSAEFYGRLFEPTEELVCVASFPARNQHGFCSIYRMNTMI